MSQIVKSEAIVLSKINYGDSSIIVSLYTKDFGKLSAIVKGVRSPKSKIGLSVDPLNYINVVLYNKDSRDVQLLSGADIIAHFPRIKGDLEGLKYALAILELIQKLVPEHEQNLRLFAGVQRILFRIDSSDEIPQVLFGRFMLFFFTELGYEIILDYCSNCGNGIKDSCDAGYSFHLGILCKECKENYSDSFLLKKELFSYLNCLKHNNKISTDDQEVFDLSNRFMEMYLKFHHSDFKGIQSLKIYQ